MPDDCEVCAIHRETNAELSANNRRVREQLDDLRRDVELALRTLGTEQDRPRAQQIDLARSRLATGLASTAPARGRGR